MKLIVTLIKDVSDQAEAEQRVEQIKEFIAPLPDVKLTAKTNKSIEPPEDDS